MQKSKLNLECGIRLKECLADSQMTQNELSSLTGYTQQYISNIVVGKKPMTIKAASLFAKYLNVRQEFLLCEDDLKDTTASKAMDLECSIQIGRSYLYLLNAFGITAIGIIANLKNGDSIKATIPKDTTEFNLTEQQLIHIMNKEITRHISPSNAEDPGIYIKSFSIVCQTMGEDVIIPIAQFREFTQDLNDYIRFKSYEFVQKYIPNESSVGLSYGNWFDINIILELLRNQS